MGHASVLIWGSCTGESFNLSFALKSLLREALLLWKSLFSLRPPREKCPVRTGTTDGRECPAEVSLLLLHLKPYTYLHASCQMTFPCLIYNAKLAGLLTLILKYPHSFFFLLYFSILPSKRRDTIRVLCIAAYFDCWCMRPNMNSWLSKTELSFWWRMHAWICCRALECKLPANSFIEKPILEYTWVLISGSQTLLWVVCRIAGASNVDNVITKL